MARKQWTTLIGGPLAKTKLPRLEPEQDEVMFLSPADKTVMLVYRRLSPAKFYYSDRLLPGDSRVKRKPLRPLPRKKWAMLVAQGLACPYHEGQVCPKCTGH